MFTDLSEDVVSLYLLWMIGLLIGLPSILLIAWRVTRPPFRIASFRWLYLAWVCLLVSASVWTISRQARFSVEEAGADNYTRLAFLGLGILVILAVGAAYRFAFFSELGTGALGIFFLFSVWGLASTVWSVSPAGTLYKASEYCAMLALFALAASCVEGIYQRYSQRLIQRLVAAVGEPAHRFRSIYPRGSKVRRRRLLIKTQSA